MRKSCCPSSGGHRPASGGPPSTSSSIRSSKNMYKSPDSVRRPVSGGPVSAYTAVKSSSTGLLEKYKDYAAVVIDTGTGFTKSGLAGDDKPRSIVPTLVGVPRYSTKETPLYYIGKSIPPQRSEVSTHVVMTHGVVTDWAALEMLWHHIFYKELSVCPEELAVLVTDAPLSPTTNREKMAELLFENFEVPAMYVVNQSLLSVYSYGRTSGLVIGSGYGTSYTAPVHDGYIIPHATYRLDIAGNALTEYLAKLMGESGNPFQKEEMEVVCHIKETCGYVAQEYESELNADEKKYLIEYTLPDNQVISIGSERFRCSEVLFNPTMLDFPEVGLHIQAINSVRKCKAERQTKLLSNVLLAGGSTMLHGFSERIKRELQKMETTSKIGIMASPTRNFSAWLGGSIVASLNSFQKIWISRQDYIEKGSFVVHRHHF